MNLEAALYWNSANAAHVDRLIVREGAAQADGRWAAAARALGEGQAQVVLDAAPWCQPAGLPDLTLPRGAFRLPAAPLAGRFYPRLAIEGAGQGARDLRPVRITAVEDMHLSLNPNHPLADAAARLTLRATAAEPAPAARLADLFDGPGLQAPPEDWHAAYGDPAGLGREDEAPDATFYAQPRLIQHLDAACRAEIRALYGRLLTPGARVLDCMASFDSHLPPAAKDCFVAGLGMNAAELEANPLLHERVVKDLNQRSGLPWGPAQFDLAVCTASVEYLQQPLLVLRDLRRVLRPGGCCVLTFSDRWFPSKAIRLWSQLHPFERLGWALGLLREAGFTALHSETLRGLARPADDKYIDQRAHADPLFAAWGTA